MAAIVPFLPSIIGAITSGISGRSAAKAPRETAIQGRQRELIDQLLSSLGGDGPFSNLFSMDNDSFQKSFVDPAKQMFQGQIAPQIQQSFVASGQHRGTGMEDALTRAGVDLDQMLNQNLMQYQQGAMNRQSSAIGNILSQAQGAPPQISSGQGFAQGLSGFIGGKGFPEILKQAGETFRSGFKS